MGSVKVIGCIRLVLSVVLAICLASCEKHDGVSYFKSKCIAEMNGQTYIDQSPLTYIFSPAGATPSIHRYGNCLTQFKSNLKIERDGGVVYYVEINLYTDDESEYIDKEYIFERTDIPDWDETMSDLEYLLFCEYNSISYAKINGDIMDSGTFRITSYDRENGAIKNGKFTLTYRGRVMSGEFWF